MQYHHGKIIEYTKPLAVITESMVSAAGKIATNTALNGALCRANGSACSSA